jgi:hypothetical protein
MGKRNQWTAENIAEYVANAGGNLALAAQLMNADEGFDRDKVTRQNLQTWINADAPSEGSGTATTMDNFELTRTNRNLTNRNNKLARELRGMGDAVISKADTLQAIAQAVSATHPTNEWPHTFPPKINNGRGITIEVLFSDLQIGKLMDGYDSQVAVRRVEEYIEVIMARIASYELQGYRIEKIILAVLGDVIESDKKHENSGRGCDIGTADQMKMAIELLYHQIIKRLATVGAPMDVVMITGNHDHDGHGLSMFMPGREHLSWPLYHAVRMLSEAQGIDAEFFIPEGSHLIHSVYGCNILYEHGVGVATSEAAMKSHVAKRINQTKQYIHLYRMGDKHNICRFNNDRFVVNGAFFGDDRIGSDFSGIKGYDGEPAQVMFAYVQRTDDRRTPIFDSLVIQLGHIT